MKNRKMFLKYKFYQFDFLVLQKLLETLNKAIQTYLKDKKN